jgi:hypothetical protein
MVEKEEKRKKLKIKGKKKKKPKKRQERTTKNLVNLSRGNTGIPMSQAPPSTVASDMIRQALLNVGNGRMPSNTNRLRDILSSQSLSKDAGISNSMRMALMERLNQGDFNTTRNPRQPSGPVYGPSNRVRTPLLEPVEKYYDSMMKGFNQGTGWIKDNWNTILPAGVAVGAISEEQAQRWAGPEGADRFSDEAVAQITERGREFINTRMNNRRRPPPPPPSQAEQVNNEVENPRNFEGAGRFSSGLGDLSSRTIASILGVGGAVALGSMGLQNLRNMASRNIFREEVRDVGTMSNNRIRGSEQIRNQQTEELERRANDALTDDLTRQYNEMMEESSRLLAEPALSGREQAGRISAPNTPEQIASVATMEMGTQTGLTAQERGLVKSITPSGAIRYVKPENVPLYTDLADMPKVPTGQSGDIQEQPMEI